MPIQAKSIEGDTYSAVDNKNVLDRCVIDGHIDLDSTGGACLERRAVLANGCCTGQGDDD